jgi:hypothetical protein
MADDHFSKETLERFLRSELSREENRSFVRHLLRQCPQCSGLLRELAPREDFKMLMVGLDGPDGPPDPDPIEQRPLARVARFAIRGARASP